MVNYRHIKLEELNSDLFSSFIRQQEVNLCYRQVNQQSVIQEDPLLMIGQVKTLHNY